MVGVENRERNRIRTSRPINESDGEQPGFHDPMGMRNGEPDQNSAPGRGYDERDVVTLPKPVVIEEDNP